MANEMEQMTPGPWLVNTDPNYERGKPAIIWTAYGPGHGAVCELSPIYPREFNAANARLIAAAPDLLAACKQLKFANDQYGDKRDHSIDPDTEWEKALDMIDAAIAKASGVDAALSSARGDAGEKEQS